MRLCLLLLLITLCPSLFAAELFGVALVDASRDQLRNAVKQAGITLVSQAGDDAFFDVYNSEGVLPGSTHLFLGFVKQDQTFAFAEYLFSGLQQPDLLQKLTSKYGEPRVNSGQFLTDQHYRWESQGVIIELSPDWQNYQTHLTYFLPQRLKQLRLEQKSFQATVTSQQSLFNQQAY